MVIAPNSLKFCLLALTLFFLLPGCADMANLTDATSSSKCPSGQIYGSDHLCHDECGNTKSYCTGTSQCYEGQCLSCNSSKFLGPDGKCHSIETPAKCPSGQIIGQDKLCHDECGNNNYCTPPSQCYNGQCKSCKAGYVYASGDDLCHQVCGDSGTYCTGTSHCFNGKCLSCPSGQTLKADGLCYAAGSGTAAKCQPGYIYGDDKLCHKQCGSGNIYCSSNTQCFNGRCLGCPSGQYLGNDGMCHAAGAGYCTSGLIYGNDGFCHPECGNTGTYCDGTLVCLNGQCMGCKNGQYLGTDGYCYSNDAYAWTADYVDVSYTDGGGSQDGTFVIECVAGWHLVTESLCCMDGYGYGGDSYCYQTQ